MRPAIFVSYSHSDSHLVGPLVALLRASEALVFKDSDSLVPGRKWRDQLATAIGESHTVLVFWCQHSSRSEEVRSEYCTAIELGKDVLPVLVDTTPLPAALAEYQYIDFREAFPAGHTREEPSPPSPSRVRAKFGLGAWLGAVAVAFAVSSVWTLKAPTGSSSPGSTGSTALLWWLGLGVVVLLVLTLVRRFLRRDEVQYKVNPSATPVTQQQQVRMASQIAQELRKRTHANEA